MKTFKDLEFKPHPLDSMGFMAHMFFDNGYGISVVRFYGSYTRKHDEWEVAVLRGTAKSFVLCYDTDITDDVLGYQSKKDVTNIMKKIQTIKP